MGTALVSDTGKRVMREHLVDIFAEIACYSSKEANLLLDKYPEYRYAVGSLEHVFWQTGASKMLDEATSVEFKLRMRDCREDLGKLYAAH